MKSPFTFQHFEHIPRCQVWVETAYKHFCALNYAHSGQILWAAEGGEPKVLTAPVAWWTWPGPRFCYGRTEAPGWDHYYVTFQGAWVDQLLHADWLPSAPASAWRLVSNADAFRFKMERLQFLLDQHTPHRAWLLLQDMFLDINTQKPSAAPEGPHMEKLHSLIARIRRQPAREWNEEEVARSCGLSQVHFRRLFRRATGFPFRQFCLSERMDTAARMLRKTGLPLKEVAERCGIPDIYYFTRLFKSHHGVPPGAYAREVRMLANR